MRFLDKRLCSPSLACPTAQAVGGDRTHQPLCHRHYMCEVSIPGHLASDPWLYADCVVRHAQTKRRDWWGIDPCTGSASIGSRI